MLILKLLRLEFVEAEQLAERQFELCSRYGLADFLAAAIGCRGTALAMQENKQGIYMIEQWIASGRRTGLKMVRPFELCCLAEACIAHNQFERASQALDEALTIAEQDGVRYCEPATHHLRGILLLTKEGSNRSGALDCFERAIEIAREQNGRSWELRATVSLARLLRDTNRPNEARTVVGEIYDWFTEGFDLPDLKEAKALLDELSE